MQKLLSLLAITAFLASCTSSPDTEMSDDEATDQETSQTEKSEGLVEFSSLEFTAPSDWTMLEEPYEEGSKEIATFSVPDSEYEVTLSMEVIENKEGLDEDDMEHATDLGNGLAYLQDGCNGLACYIIGTDEYSASVVFYVESTEEPPADLDAPWFPSTDLSDEDLENFMETAELTAK